jgi:squalene cyclase
VTSPSEAFDSALAVLALAELSPQLEVRNAVQKGRQYLLAAQLDDGSWTETTRPTGGESYAQRISTTAWALLALLASR